MKKNILNEEISRIKNMMDYMGMADLYECELQDLQKLNEVITKLFKQKEPSNG